MSSTDETRHQVDSVGITGLWVAGLRALETARPDAVFTDPYALDLCGPEIDKARQVTGAAQGYNLNALLLRTCMGDAVLTDAAARGIRQTVILGAGMDTRAYRLPLPPDLTVWEIDRAAPLTYKQEVLAAKNATTRCRRIPVTADVSEPWDQALAQNGFDPRLRTLWMVEGLLLYLDTRTTDFVARTITKNSAPASELYFDAYSTKALDAPEFTEWRTAFTEQGTVLGPSMENPEQWITGYGWKADAYDRTDVLEGRCPWVSPEPQRIAQSFLPHSWLVHATQTPA